MTALRGARQGCYRRDGSKAYVRPNRQHIRQARDGQALKPPRPPAPTSLAGLMGCTPLVSATPWAKMPAFFLGSCWAAASRAASSSARDRVRYIISISLGFYAGGIQAVDKATPW